MRRDAVVRQAVPGRQFLHHDVGREEGKSTRQRRHARAIAADHHETRRRRLAAGGHRPRQVGDHQAFGAIGDARQRQRLAGRQ
jgi:hypothetical protein